jgi:hypothetical protein
MYAYGRGEDIAPFVLKHHPRNMEAVDEFHFPHNLPYVKSPRYPVNRRLVGPRTDLNAYAFRKTIMAFSDDRSGI